MKSRELSDPLDVLIVIGGLGVGGAERHVSYVSRALQCAGWNVGVYSLAGDGPVRADLEAAGIRVMSPPVDQASLRRFLVFRLVWMFLAEVHLTYVLWRTKPRIAHFFLPAAYLMGALAASLAGVKIRVMSRRSLNDYQLSYPVTRWIELKLHGGMSAILGNSMAVVRQLQDEEGVDGDKLGLIYNGIGFTDRDSNRAQVRSSLGIADSTLVFIVVANLIPYKGHADLIKALGFANERIDQPWRLLVVGRDDGAEREIREIVFAQSLEEKVSFLGMRLDVPDLLAASDIGLLSSHQEGFSNTILEGMAAALPMIVTNVGGNAEAVVDGETGLVVPPRDPRSLADAIVRLARDPSLRERYGAAGRKRVEELFLLDACVARYEALYRGLMQGKTPHDIPEVSYGSQSREAG